MTTGASSSFPLTRLAAKYRQMATDGRVLSNRQAIDIVDTRIVQLLERIDVDDAPDRMEKLVALWAEYTQAHDSSRTAEEGIARIKLDNEFEKAYHDYAAWKQMFEALDLRKRMVEGEIKILTQIKAIITAEDAYELSAKMLAAVMHVVNDDPRKMKQVQYEFARIIGEVGDDVAKRLAEDDAGVDGEVGGAEGPGDVDQA